MSNRKAGNWAKRLQTIIAVVVLFSMIMGGAAIALTINTSPSQPTPSSGQSR